MPNLPFLISVTKPYAFFSFLFVIKKKVLGSIVIGFLACVLGCTESLASVYVANMNLVVLTVTLTLILTITLTVTFTVTLTINLTVKKKIKKA